MAAADEVWADSCRPASGCFMSRASCAEANTNKREIVKRDEAGFIIVDASAGNALDTEFLYVCMVPQSFTPAMSLLGRL